MILGLIYLIACVNSSFLLLGSIPLCRYATICFFIHLLMDIWVVSSFLLLLTKLLWTFTYKHMNDHMLLFFLDKELAVEMTGHIVGVFFTFQETAKIFFSKWLYHFAFPSGNAKAIPWLACQQTALEQSDIPMQNTKQNKPLSILQTIYKNLCKVDHGPKCKA